MLNINGVEVFQTLETLGNLTVGKNLTVKQLATINQSEKVLGAVTVVPAAGGGNALVLKNTGDTENRVLITEDPYVDIKTIAAPAAPAANYIRIYNDAGVLKRKNSAGAVVSFEAAGHTIEDEGIALTQRSKLNFVGGGVAVTDDVANDRSIVTITAGATVSGTPADNQLSVWTSATQIEGDANLTWDATFLRIVGTGRGIRLQSQLGTDSTLAELMPVFKGTETQPRFAIRWNTNTGDVFFQTGTGAAGLTSAILIQNSGPTSVRTVQIESDTELQFGNGGLGFVRLAATTLGLRSGNILRIQGTGALQFDADVSQMSIARGAANRLDINNSDVQLSDAKNIIVGTTTGTKIGTSTLQKLAFYNATPVVQQAGIADEAGIADTTYSQNEVDMLNNLKTKLNSVLATLEALGFTAVA